MKKRLLTKSNNTKTLAEARVFLNAECRVQNAELRQISGHKSTDFVYIFVSLAKVAISFLVPKLSNITS